MLPSTAPFGADPDSHHHSCLQLLTQWHLHHRGPCRPDQDLHLWVFKGRGSSTCSAQICVSCKQFFVVEEIITVEQAGLGGPGQGLQNEHEAVLHLPWLKLRVTLSKKKKALHTKLFFFSQVTDDGAEDKDGTTVSSSGTVTTETTIGTTVTTTTTHISKVKYSLALSFRAATNDYFHYDESADYFHDQHFVL